MVRYGEIFAIAPGASCSYYWNLPNFKTIMKVDTYKNRKVISIGILRVDSPVQPVEPLYQHFAQRSQCNGLSATVAVLPCSDSLALYEARVAPRTATWQPFGFPGGPGAVHGGCPQLGWHPMGSLCGLPQVSGCFRWKEFGNLLCWRTACPVKS